MDIVVDHYGWTERHKVYKLHPGQTPVIEHWPPRRLQRFLFTWFLKSSASFSKRILCPGRGSLDDPISLMDDAPDSEQRQLNLPAVQPISLGDTSSSSTVPSTRFYVPAQTSHTYGSKGLNKRPSTAALAQSNDVLLPATRQATINSNNIDDAIANSTGSAVQDARSIVVNKGLDDRFGSNVNVSCKLRDRIDCSRAPSLITEYPFLGESTSSASEGVSNDPNLSSKDNGEFIDESFDWGSFLQAYAAGKWDPRLTPNPPKSQYISETEAGYPHPDSSSQSAAPGGFRKRTPGTSSSSSIASRFSFGSTNGRSPASVATSASSSASSTYSSSASGTHKSIKYRRQADQQGDGVLPHLPLPPPPTRPFSSRSMSDSSSSVYAPPLSSESLAKVESLHELHTAAATMRVAAEGVDVRPLAIPSPEVELTDPFRGYTASLTLAPRPDPDGAIISENEFNPVLFGSPSEGGHNQTARKIRLNSFWNVLGDVMGNSSAAGPRNSAHSHSAVVLPTISASPPITPEDANAGTDSATNPDAYVTAELLPSGSTSEKLSRDYFTIPVSRRNQPSPAYTRSTNSLQGQVQTSVSSSTTTSTGYASVFESSPASSRLLPLSRPPLDRTVSEPVSLKDANNPDLLLGDTLLDTSGLGGRSYSESHKYPRVRIKEEMEYLQRGYLRPPTPPNEWERQKALYKYVESSGLKGSGINS